MTKTFEQLLEAFLRDELTAEEQPVFLQQARLSINDPVILSVLHRKFLGNDYNGLSGEPDLDQKFREMLQRAQQIEFNNKPVSIKRGSVSMLRRMAVAAAVVVTVSLGVYFFMMREPGTKQEVVNTPAHNDIKAPGTNRAMITLQDGQVVYLDSSNNGQLAMQGNTKLVKKADGQIIYESAAAVTTAAIITNTLFNPKGSKVIDMTLADGSRVWLNAGSSVTYPVAFTGKTRKVSVTGEAYFEVAHDKTKPFFVSKDNMQVQVLGTKFNVNAYDDEREILVTLLEGSVAVEKTASNGQGSKVTIQPGEQAEFAGDEATIRVTQNVDIEQVMAWKNGIFKFGGNDVETVMRQLSRWYDVEVVFEGEKPLANFRGTISRTGNISEVLKMLELTKAIQFKIEEKKVIVTK